MIKLLLSMFALTLSVTSAYANPHGAFVGRAFVGRQTNVNVNVGRGFGGAAFVGVSRFTPFRSTAVFVPPGLGVSASYGFGLGRQLGFQRGVSFQPGYGVQAQLGLGYGQASYGVQQQLAFPQASIGYQQQPFALPQQDVSYQQTTTTTCGATGLPLAPSMAYGVLRGVGGCR